MLKSKNRKRGFTLVEVIVVLVILAILAAIMIPALTGWIEKSKKAHVISETRHVYEAAQAVTSELYAGSTKWQSSSAPVTLASDSGNPSTNSHALKGTNLKKNYEEVVKLSELPQNSKFFVLVNGKGKVQAVIYHSEDNYLGVYFSDTKKCSAYRIGEKTEYSNTGVSDAYYSNNFYSTIHYQKEVDQEATKDNHEPYSWSCSGIRWILGIGPMELPE